MSERPQLLYCQDILDSGAAILLYVQRPSMILNRRIASSVPSAFPYERVETKKRTSELDQEKFMQLAEGIARNALTHTSPAGLAINFMKPENRSITKG